MAFTMNTSGRNGRHGRYRPLAEINVTPLVDVMLVLLIIFMVTAPLMTSGVSVDLPKTNAQPLNSDSEPLTVSIKADGSIFLQDQPIDLSEIIAKLQAISKNNADRRIFVRGDKDLAYGRIMEVMGTITQGGFTKVALLAEQTAAPQSTGTPPATPAARTESVRHDAAPAHRSDRLDPDPCRLAAGPAARPANVCAKR
jgi:biopolymer transport protein TolR